MATRGGDCERRGRHRNQRSWCFRVPSSRNYSQILHHQAMCEPPLCTSTTRRIFHTMLNLDSSPCSNSRVPLPQSTLQLPLSTSPTCHGTLPLTPDPPLPAPTQATSPTAPTSPQSSPTRQPTNSTLHILTACLAPLIHSTIPAPPPSRKCRCRCRLHTVLPCRIQPLLLLVNHRRLPHVAIDQRVRLKRASGHGRTSDVKRIITWKPQ